MVKNKNYDGCKSVHASRSFFTLILGIGVTPDICASTENPKEARVEAKTSVG
jgi:hypothetical protein